MQAASMIVLNSSFSNSSILQNATTKPPVHEEQQEPMAARVAKTVALSVVFLFSLAGNSLILGSVIRNTNRRMRTVSNLLIVNTSVVYLLITIVNIPGLITNINLIHGFVTDGTFGAVICALRSSVPFLTVSLSTQSFALLSLDRFIAVYYPVRRISQKTACILIGLTWLTSCAFGSVYAYGSFVVKEPYGTLVCAIHVSRTFGGLRGLVTYVWIEFAVFFFFPLVMASVLYAATIIKLWRHSIPGRGGQFPTVPSHSERINRNAVKMLVIVLITFAASWIPLWIYMITCRGTVKRFLQHPICRDVEFLFVRYFMGYSNCAIVPYIYPIYSQNFRAGFKDILRTYSCCLYNYCRRCSDEGRNQITPLPIRRCGHSNRPDINMVNEQVTPL